MKISINDLNLYITDDSYRSPYTSLFAHNSYKYC